MSIEQLGNQEGSVEKREYHTPKLVAYGPLRALTQNGTKGTVNENNGKKICGTAYLASGNKSC